MMDLNLIFLVMAVVSCIRTLVAAVRALPRPTGWIFVSSAIIAVAGILYFIRPDLAGYGSGGLWVLLLLVPSLAQRAARTRSLRQKYDRAVPWAFLAGLLHPFDGFPQQAFFLRAMSLAEKGDTAGAVAIFQTLETSSRRQTARVAQVQSRGLLQDWPGLIASVEANFDPAILSKQHDILPLYVRALGETGRLAEMLRLATSNNLSQHPQLLLHRQMCRLFAFAFCGQPSRVEECFHGSLRQMPEAVRKYWIATATYAAGELSTAEHLLFEVERIASARQRVASEYRRAHPPATAGGIVTPADQLLLDQLDTQQDHERRFIPFQTGRKPWVTYAIVMANLIVFAIEWAMGVSRDNMVFGGTSSEIVLHRLGALNSQVLQTHEYFRLFMVNFLHYGYLHILMNMLGLLFLGPFIEFSLGRLLYPIIYLSSGVGMAATVLLLEYYQWLNSEGEMVGASGAIMALIGATIAILLRGWYKERAGVAGRQLRVLASLVILQVVFDYYTPEVSGSAHIIGLIWGFVLTSLLPHQKRRSAGKVVPAGVPAPSPA